MPQQLVVQDDDIPDVGAFLAHLNAEIDGLHEDILNVECGHPICNDEGDQIEV